jgi:bacterioferritin-associated ferredoxin
VIIILIDELLIAAQELSAMYVCVCHAVTDRQISASVAMGATSLKDLREELGVGSCCGKCARDVREQLRSELGSCQGCGGCGRKPS